MKDYPPAKFTGTAKVSNSMISDGCIVSGVVKNSILFRGVVVKAGARVENSIIMQDSVIEEGALVKNAIVDKNCMIRQNRC